jgi:hypothetical protein
VVPQDISRCALSAGFPREQDDKRSAEHRDKENAAVGGSDSSKQIVHDIFLLNPLARAYWNDSLHSTECPKGLPK